MDLDSSVLTSWLSWHLPHLLHDQQALTHTRLTQPCSCFKAHQLKLMHPLRPLVPLLRDGHIQQVHWGQVPLIASLLENVPARAASCMVQVRDITMDFSSDLIVGLGLAAEAKARIKQHFLNFTKNVYSIRIDLPGTGYRKARDAKKGMLAVMRGHIQAVMDRAVAGEFRQGSRTALQHLLNARLDEGDTLEIQALSVRPACLADAPCYMSWHRLQAPADILAHTAATSLL